MKASSLSLPFPIVVLAFPIQACSLRPCPEIPHNLAVCRSNHILHKRAFFTFFFSLKRMSLFCFLRLVLLLPSYSSFLITAVMPRRKLCHVRLLCGGDRHLSGRQVLAERSNILEWWWRGPCGWSVDGGWKWDHYATHLINHPKFTLGDGWPGTEGSQRVSTLVKIFLDHFSFFLLEQCLNWLWSDLKGRCLETLRLMHLFFYSTVTMENE